jgi:hypothetical protein
MILENLSPKQVEYAPFDGYESRIQRRLRHDLGIDASAAETILHLRNQVIELQSHIHQLEAELATHESNQQMHLARYRAVCYEATWIEFDFDE